MADKSEPSAPVVEDNQMETDEKPVEQVADVALESPPPTPGKRELSSSDEDTHSSDDYVPGQPPSPVVSATTSTAEPTKRTPPIANIIQPGVDNLNPIDITEIYIPLGDNSSGIKTVRRWLKTALNKNPRENSVPRNLGVHKQVRDVYMHVPSVRGIATVADTTEPGGAELDNQLTRRTLFMDKKVAAYLWDVDPSLKQCFHTLQEGEPPCLPGCCILRRKEYILKLYLNPMPAVRQPDGSYTYTNVKRDAQNQVAAKKRARVESKYKKVQSQVDLNKDLDQVLTAAFEEDSSAEDQREGPPAPKRKVIEPPPAEAPIINYELQIGVPVEWEIPAEGCPNIIITGYVDAIFNQYLGIRCHEKSYELLCFLWEQAGFTKQNGFPPPTRLGLLFAGRDHKKVKDDDLDFYYLSPAIGTPPAHRTTINRIEVPWWDDIFSPKMAHESWDALIPVGAQLRMRINSRWTYGNEAWRKGMPCPQNRPGWPNRHEPTNWAVEFFTLPDPSKYPKQYCDQPALYGAPGLIYGVNNFRLYKEILFKASAEPATKQYYENELEAAANDQRDLELDWKFLPKENRPDFSDYKIPGLPEDEKTQGAKIILGVPSHATGLPVGKKAAKAEMADRVGQMALTWVDTADAVFHQSVSQDNIDRDYSVQALTRTDHDVRSYQFTYQDGSKVISQSGDIDKRLKGELTWVMWTHIAGMPAGKVHKGTKRTQRSYVLKCMIGLGAVRQWAYFLAPQFTSDNLPFPMPQLVGCAELDRRVLMTLAAMAAMYAAELKSLFMASQKSKVPAMTRVTGSETDPVVEILLPTMWNHKLTQMKAKESQDVRLTTFRYNRAGKMITLVSRWRVTAVTPAYKFDAEGASCDRQTYMTRNNLYTLFEDPYDNKRFLYPTAHLTLDKIPLEAKFEWHEACDITDIEISGFKPPREHAAMWPTVGSLVQLKLDRPSQVLHVMENRLLAENRYFVAQGVENAIAQRIMQHIVPTNFTRLFDLNHKQLQLPLREHPALFDEIRAKATARNAEVMKAGYDFDSNLHQWIDAGPFGLDTRIGGIISPNMVDLMLAFPVKYAQPAYNLLHNAAAVNLDLKDNVAPKNFIAQLLLGLVVGKQEDPNHFISDDEVDKALQKDWVRDIVYPPDEKEKPDIHQARIIYRIVILRQPLAFICGPPGCGKTATVRRTLKSLRRMKQTTYANGFPIRDDCHPDYLRPGQNLLPPELETTFVLTAANYPNDQVCELLVEEYLGPTGTYFDSRLVNLFGVALYRHYGSLFEHVRTAKSSVKSATFIQILESVNPGMLPGNMATNKTVYDELNEMIREDMTVITGYELARNKPAAQQRREKLSEHVKDRLKYANDLFDELLETVHFDVIACTFAMGIDLKLRHPQINARTIIIDEASQASFAEIMSSVSLLHTQFPDPVIAAFGDSKQMSAINHLTGRASKVMAVDLMALRTNPAEAIPGAFGLPPTSWKGRWKLNEPQPVVEGSYLRTCCRNNESLAGLIMHNYYTADGKPQFTPAQIHLPRIKLEFKDANAAERAGFDRCIRQVLDRDTSNFENPFIPALVRGIDTALWDVTDSVESDKLTSKSNENMVNKAIALIDMFCRKMNIVWPENLAFLCAYDGLRQELLEAIRTKFGLEKDYEARENFGHTKGWQTKISNIANITVGTWDGMQGQEFRVVVCMCPRAMEEKKERRHVAAGTVKSAQCTYKQQFPNTPIIDHDLAEAEFGAHLIATLGFTDNLNKFLVAISRAMRFLLIMHESHTMDFSRHWNLLTRFYDINGLTTFNYIQEVENALAHSSNPPDWYGESDMLMAGIDTSQDTNQPAKVDEHGGFLQATFDPTQKTHLYWDETFFRQLPQMIYKDFLYKGDIVAYSRVRPKIPLVDQCRKDWDTVPAEPQRSFRLYQQKTLVYPAYDDAKVPDESDEFMKARMITSVPEDIKDWRHRMYTNKLTQADWDALEAPPPPRPESPDVRVLEDGEEEMEPVGRKELTHTELLEYLEVLSNAQAWRGAYSHGLFTRMLAIYRNHREQFDAEDVNHTINIPPNYDKLYVKVTNGLQRTPKKLLETIVDFLDTDKYKMDDIRRSWDCLQIAKLDYVLCTHKYTNLLQELNVTHEQVRDVWVLESPSEVTDGVRYIMPFERNYYNYTTSAQVHHRFIEMRRQEQEEERQRALKEDARQQEARRKEQLAVHQASLRYVAPLDQRPGIMPKDPLKITVGGASAQPSTSTGGITQHGPRFRAEGYVPQPPAPPHPAHWAPQEYPRFPFNKPTRAHPLFGSQQPRARARGPRGAQQPPLRATTPAQWSKIRRTQQQEAEYAMLQKQAWEQHQRTSTNPDGWKWKSAYEEAYPPSTQQQGQVTTQPVPPLPPMPVPTDTQPVLQPPLPPPQVEIAPQPPQPTGSEAVEPKDQVDKPQVSAPTSPKP